MTWHVKFEKRKVLKKDLNEELMLVRWNVKRWWNFCITEIGNKETEPILTE